MTVSEFINFWLFRLFRGGTCNIWYYTSLSEIEGLVIPVLRVYLGEIRLLEVILLFLWLLVFRQHAFLFLFLLPSLLSLHLNLLTHILPHFFREAPIVILLLFLIFVWTLFLMVGNIHLRHNVHHIVSTAVEVWWSEGAFGQVAGKRYLRHDVCWVVWTRYWLDTWHNNYALGCFWDIKNPFETFKRRWLWIAELWTITSLSLTTPCCYSFLVTRVFSFSWSVAVLPQCSLSLCACIFGGLALELGF